MRKTVLALAILANGAAAFAPASPALSRGAQPPRSIRSGAAAVCMTADGTRATRRETLAASAAAAFALLAPNKPAVAAGLALGYGVSEKDANAQLSAFGLPTMDKVPGGFKPLIIPVGGTQGANIDGSKTIESIGSALTRSGLKKGEKVLLNFVYPSAWIVNVPIEDGNGESGTVSANNYVKGDSAVVSALPLESGKNIASQEKEYFQDLLTQQVPQGLWQSFKLVKKTPAGEQAGQEVVDIEYRYDLITSGPIVGRHGFARIVHVGGSAVALGATTSDTRFKGMKDALVTSATSFRSTKVQADLSLSGSSSSLKSTAAYSQEAKARLAAKAEAEEEEEE